MHGCRERRGLLKAVRLVAGRRRRQVQDRATDGGYVSARNMRARVRCNPVTLLSVPRTIRARAGMSALCLRAQTPSGHKLTA